MPSSLRSDLGRRCLAEAFGTFALVFAGCGAIVVNSERGGSLGAVGIAAAFGLVIMLALAEWLTPDFSIDGFWTYVGATIVVWLVNVTVGWVLDRVRE